jgi:hypothetical protein
MVVLPLPDSIARFIAVLTELTHITQPAKAEQG